MAEEQGIMGFQTRRPVAAPLMFNEDICAYPCPRFVTAGEDPLTGMILCANCNMLFVDDDPINFGGDEDNSMIGGDKIRGKK